MHVILGLTIAEWVGVLTIVTTFMTAVYKMLFKPLMSKFDELSAAINHLSENSQLIHEHINDHLGKHDLILERHNTEIDFLFDFNHLKRK